MKLKLVMDFDRDHKKGTAFEILDIKRSRGFETEVAVLIQWIKKEQAWLSLAWFLEEPE